METAQALALAARLFAAYPGSRPPEFSVNIYAETLEAESFQVGQRAVLLAMEGSPHRIPTLPELWLALDAAKVELAPRSAPPELGGVPATPEEIAAILQEARKRMNGVKVTEPDVPQVVLDSPPQGGDDEPQGERSAGTCRRCGSRVSLEGFKGNRCDGCGRPLHGEVEP